MKVLNVCEQNINLSIYISKHLKIYLNIYFKCYYVTASSLFINHAREVAYS